MTLELHFTTTSPFARQTRMAILEAGLEDRIELRESNPWVTESGLGEINPQEKVPALVLDDGRVMTENLLISQYLDRVHGDARLVPEDDEGRFDVLRLAALANGVIEASVLVLIETVRRPEALRWQDWIDRQRLKITRTLALLEREVDALGVSAPDGRTDLAQIAVGAMLGYLDFRFSGIPWRPDQPKLAAWYATFAERPSMRATMPPES